MCGERFSPMNVTQVVCGPACAVRYNSPEEVQKRYDVMVAQSTRLSVLLFKAKEAFQKWIRMRDKNDSCISCHNTDSQQWDAGHYYSAEEYPGLIFHQDNVHKQCCYCNKHLKGNIIPYREGIIKKIGTENIELLELLSEQAKTHVFSKEELAGITRLYKDKVKQLKT